jgi:small subunit ribosomal protein S2
VSTTEVTLSRLIESGVHFGHRASRWNPKMKKYIYGKRNLIHIIDLRETLRGMIKATGFVERLARQGGAILFVGTKRQAREIVRQQSQIAGSPYVCERWLGGTLTNFQTIMSRLKRLEELESLEETGEIDRYSKKMVSSLRREKRKINRNLGGLRGLSGLPKAVVLVDPNTEYNCVREARKLKIPVIALVDTNSDPEDCDIVIPGNDDAFRSIRMVVSTLAQAVKRGREKHVQALEAQRKLEADKRRKEAERQEALRKAREAAIAEKKAEKAAADAKSKAAAPKKAEAKVAETKTAKAKKAADDKKAPAATGAAPAENKEQVKAGPRP